MDTSVLLSFAQQNMIPVALAATSGGMLIWSLISDRGNQGLTPAEATLKINRDDAVVVDVRETSEWAKGRIPDARHLTLGQIEERISELEKFKERPVIVYCASGNRSATACTKLKKAGFTQVFNLNGGITAWTDAGLPVTKK